MDGDDPVLVAEEVRRLVKTLAGDDPALSVEDFWGDDVDLDAVAGACLTPPFLSDRRVVILRDAGRFGTDALGPLLAFLDDPLPTTALIVAAGGGRLAPKLTAAIKAVGHVVATGPGRDTKGWLEGRLKQAPLRFEPSTRSTLAVHLGDSVSRLPALLEVLVATYGEGATIGPAELEPFLGEAGGIAPWDLTDAIDQGDTDAALVALHRLLTGGERHPLVVAAILYRHVAPMMALDGAAVRGRGGGGPAARHRQGPQHLPGPQGPGHRPGVGQRRRRPGHAAPRRGRCRPPGRVELAPRGRPGDPRRPAEQAGAPPLAGGAGPGSGPVEDRGARARAAPRPVATPLRRRRSAG